MSKNWFLYKQKSSNSKCSSCGKLTENVAKEEWVIDYTQCSNYILGMTRKETFCLNCGNLQKKAQDYEINEEVKEREKQEAVRQGQLISNYLDELRKIKSELNNKVKTADLEIKDLWKIWNLKDKVNSLNNNELKKGTKELEKLVDEYASPKVKDDAKKNLECSKGIHRLKPIINSCSHQIIVPCEDDLSFYSCEYCWEQNSPEFLKLLEKRHQDDVYNNWFKNYGLSSSDINEFSLTKEFQIVKSGWFGNTIFFNQEQLRDAYKLLENKFNEFLRRKNIDKQLISINSNNSMSNNDINVSIERERERQTILSYFTTNNIQSIKLHNNKLIIKYNHKEEEEEEEEEEEPNTSELKQIKSYLQQQPTKTLTLSDLERKSKQSNNFNSTKAKPSDKTALYIGGGIIGIVLITLALILVRKNKNKSKY